MAECSYTFTTAGGEVTIKGMAAMKTFLVEKGVEAIEGASQVVMASNRAQTDTPESVVFDEELLSVARAETKAMRGIARYTLEGDSQGVIPGRARQLDREMARGLYTEQDLADEFAQTREMIRARYGDTVTLWRADAPAAQHSADTRTVYMADQATAEKYASNGREAKPYQVSVDDILAVYARPSGYFEVIARKQALDAPLAQGAQQTDTPEFKRWFGDSQAVVAVNAETGEPVVSSREPKKLVPQMMYHTTRNDFSKFEIGRLTTNSGTFGDWETSRAAAFVTPELDASQSYGTQGGEFAPGANVMPLYVKAENPLDLTGGVSEEAEQKLLNAGMSQGFINNSLGNWAMFDGEDGRAVVDAIKAAGYDSVIFNDENPDTGESFEAWALFEPNQIKSAIGNSGTFDPENPDIRYSARGRQPPVVGQRFTLPSDGAVREARIKLQDDALRMKRVIEAVREQGGTVTERQNFYDANTLMPGRIQAEIDDFKNDIVRPMIDKAVKYKIDLDELALYAYAKHAQERNDYIASINPRFPDGGSGMTNADAQAILQRVAQGGKQAQYEELHTDLMAIASTTRQLMFTEGLISQEEFTALDGAYDNYIPLRGVENVDEETGAIRPGIGRGINVRGKETIRALGRKSRAGDLIENVIRDYERVITRVEKNDVGKVMLDFVLSNPDPDLWDVDVQRTKPAFNKATGLVQYTKQVDKGEDTIGVKVGGQQVYIKIHDKAMVRAIRQAWKDETSGLERVIVATAGWWNNWLRGVLTRYNPAFAAINIPRDALWSGTTAALAELGTKGLGKYLSAYAKAMAASTRAEAGVSGTTNPVFGNPQVDRMYREFRASGGITGGFYMRSLEDISQELRDEMLLAGAAGRTNWEKVKTLPPYKAAKLTLRALEFLGAASENATRFALYMAAKEVGKTNAEAALLAKEGTTNFNRKGEWGGALNNLYLFFNASVQGTAQLGRVLRKPAVQATMAGVAGVGMMLALYGAAGGGEDDDGEAYWDKIPSYIKERNLVIMLPPGEPLADGMKRVGKRGRYITIPVQYGFNIFPNLGYMTADVLRNAQDPKRGVTPTKAAIHMTSVVFGSVNPFGGAIDLTDGVQVLLAVTPTIADLPIQIINERNTFGAPSAPERSPYDRRPDSERMFTSQQGTVPAKVVEALNELGGGNQVKAGQIMGVETSITPGTVQTLISATTGGLGSFIEQVGSSVIAMSGDDKDIKAAKVPFLNKFYGEVDEDANIRRAGDRMREVRKLVDEAKAQQRIGLDPTLTDDEQKLAALASMQESYQRAQAAMRREEIAIIRDENIPAPEKKLRRQAIQAERDRLATEVNRGYLEAISATAP